MTRIRNTDQGTPIFATTVVTIEGVGPVTVTTVDFDTPGYEINGFETTTTLPDGQSFGCGPDNNETPAQLHEALSDPAEVMRGLCDVFAPPVPPKGRRHLRAL